MKKKIIVTGATGLAGSEVIRQAILDPEVETVTALVRRPMNWADPKLKVVIHNDFSDYSSLFSIFQIHDVLIWCLGISQTQVKKEEYVRITYDYTMACATAVVKANPKLGFVFLSGMGADTKEKSRTLFARIKGKAENGLLSLPIENMFIARPGGIRPIHKKENAAWFEKILIPTYPFFEFLFPSMMISSTALAKAMLYLAKYEQGKKILENGQLKNLLIK